LTGFNMRPFTEVEARGLGKWSAVQVARVLERIG
jgi:hypothetical protein